MSSCDDKPIIMSKLKTVVLCYSNFTRISSNTKTIFLGTKYVFKNNKLFFFVKTIFTSFTPKNKTNKVIKLKPQRNTQSAQQLSQVLRRMPSHFIRAVALHLMSFQFKKERALPFLNLHLITKMLKDKIKYYPPHPSYSQRNQKECLCKKHGLVSTFISVCMKMARSPR